MKRYLVLLGAALAATPAHAAGEIYFAHCSAGDIDGGVYFTQIIKIEQAAAIPDFMLRKNLNDALAWVKDGYQAETSYAIDGMGDQFKKYIASATSRNPSDEGGCTYALSADKLTAGARRTAQMKNEAGWTVNTTILHDWRPKGAIAAQEILP